MNEKNFKINSLRESQDDIFSKDDIEGEPNYINKHQLMHLENEESLSINSDYEDLSNSNKQGNINNIKNNNFSNNDNKEIIAARYKSINSPVIATSNKHEELLRVMSDTSGKIYFKF